MFSDYKEATSSKNSIDSTDREHIASITDSIFYKVLDCSSKNSDTLQKGQKLFKRFLKREYYPIIVMDVINVISKTNLINN